jgi:hypothetical protein
MRLHGLHRDKFTLLLENYIFYISNNTQNAQYYWVTHKTVSAILAILAFKKINASLKMECCKILSIAVLIVTYVDFPWQQKILKFWNTLQTSV